MPHDAGPYKIVISPEDRPALDRAVTFARRISGDAEPRSPESDGRWVMDIIRCWYRERIDAMRGRGY